MRHLPAVVPGPLQPTSSHASWALPIDISSQDRFLVKLPSKWVEQLVVQEPCTPIDAPYALHAGKNRLDATGKNGHK